ncbi:MAG: lysine-sensitive aspartokinase 3 [Ignavibacteria bacterium]|nr:MAG: lysine-sensitive aspartokinase 3 [Ignavibacteria bacterium]
MIVMKFGGTSVEDAAAIRRVIGIVRREVGRTPLVVVSACSGVTNDLIHAAQAVRDGDEPRALSILTGLRDRHRKLIDDLIEKKGELLPSVDKLFNDLRNLIHGVYLLGELTNRSLDAITGRGEQLSSLIIHAAMEESGVPSAVVDARRVMATDRSFGAAVPDVEKVARGAREFFLPPLKRGMAVVTQGFIGAAEDGTPTTIGRGGSDLSASIFGSVLDAEEIQVWTDVDGMMTADPSIIPEARPINVLSFDEASELAYFGAKVLHPRTILPAVRKNIPVRVLNSRRPEFSGTLIVEQKSGPARRDKDIIKSIACKRGIVVINVGSSRMLMAHGFLARLFSIFANYEKSVDVVATSEVSVSLTVDSEEQLPEITRELEKIGDTRVARNKAIICVVGEGMKHTPGIAARIFGALASARVNIEMVSEGASEINLTMVVDEKDVERTVRVLHDEFFTGKD